MQETAILGIALAVGFTIHLWGENQNLARQNEALQYQLQQQQAEIRGLERGVILTR